MATPDQATAPKNYVLLTGKLERPPAVHRNPQGNPMAVLDIRTQNPETGAESDFHNTVCFGGLASWCEHNLQPGMRICVQGQLAVRRWKQGATWRKRPQIIVRQVFMAPMWSDFAPVEKLLSDDNVELDHGPDSTLGM